MSPPVALLWSRLDNKIIGQTTGRGKFQICLARYYIQSDNHRRLQSAISELPKVYRRVFEIRLRSDGSMKEIAEEAGITIGATKSRLLRARRALHSSIG
jgi:DNA-directed RNA polymerase specialized sigma24 family protein